MHNKRELRCHGVRKKKKMKEEKRSCAACHAAFSSSWRKKTIHEMLLFFKVFYGDYLEEGKSAAQQIRRSTFKCFKCKRISHQAATIFFFLAKVCVLTRISGSELGVRRIPRSFPCLSSPQVEDSDETERSHSPDWTAKREKVRPHWGERKKRKKESTHASQPIDSLIPGANRGQSPSTTQPPTHPKKKVHQ